jgi:hypothetical protein
MRIIASIIAGVLVALLVALIVAIVPIPWLQIFGPITYNIPLFYGSIVGGYIAWKYWWLSGIITGTITGIALLLFMAMIGAANFGIVKGAEMSLQVWPNMWWEMIVTLLACIAGAYLGQFFAGLAKKRHKADC